LGIGTEIASGNCTSVIANRFEQLGIHIPAREWVKLRIIIYCATASHIILHAGPFCLRKMPTVPHILAPVNIRCPGVRCPELNICVSELIYESWNFNSGNYLFTTDTK